VFEVRKKHGHSRRAAFRQAKKLRGAGFKKAHAEKESAE
jgi:hypothetical protein